MRVGKFAGGAQKPPRVTAGAPGRGRRAHLPSGAVDEARELGAGQPTAPVEPDAPAQGRALGGAVPPGPQGRPGDHVPHGGLTSGRPRRLRR